jgi:hypothetical protein
LDDFSAQQFTAHMLRRVVIGGCVAFGLLVGILLIRKSGDDSQAYAAESLLMARPFDNALLGRAFEREVRRCSPGITRLGFQVLNCSIATPNGTTLQTNGIVRLVSAGGTAAEAERLANGAADAVRTLLRQQYGLSATPFGPAQSAPASTFHEPFRLRSGNATPGYFPTASRIVFPGPAISIDPGQGWMRSYALLPTHGLGREPEAVLTLVGKRRFNGGFIQAFPLRQECTNVQSGVAALRAGAERQQGFSKSSWTEEPWAANGVQGVHMCFTQQYPAPFPGGTVLMTATTHDFLVTNAQSHWVCVHYANASSSNARPQDTMSPMASEEVQRMIRTTLRVE